MLNSLKASNILFVNDALVPFWIMQGLLAQWDFQVGYSTEKLLDNRRFFGLQPFCILGHTHANDTQIFFRWHHSGESGRGNKRRSRKCGQVVWAKRNEDERLQIPSNFNGKVTGKTTILLRKHCFSHYRRIGNAWCCCRRQNEIREAHRKCMQKSLPADRRTQANEKDPSIWNKKVSIPWIHHSSF